ncbi:hypothetical protein ABIE67_004440 [Streptomyces sp. V4I8]|uniref:hypothetical protein n=1 Tax=Streptomyces sp. V4I8 TaxID=3156469 RepID=UPI003514390D
MTDQPYQGYDGYDPYQQPAQQQPVQQQPVQQPAQQPAHQQAPQAWPGQQAYDEQQAHQQYTQQWQGQTWETHVQPPVAPASAAETSYLPSQGAGTPGVGAYAGSGYGQTGQGWDGGPQAQAQAQAYGRQPHAQQPHAQRLPSQGQAPQAQPQPETGRHGEAESGEDPGYGPATVAGNARITDAQRARLEGRSPIIEPGVQPAGLTALLGLLLAGAAAIGSYALLVPLVVLQAVTAAGWFRLNGMWPARQGIALAFAGALTADVALLASDRAPAAILGTLGVWVLLTLVLQLRSHADPDERMYGLMATVASAALSIIAGGYLAAEADAVSVGAVAVAVAVLVRALPLPTPVSVVLALLAAAGAGGMVGAMTGVGSGGALLGAGAAVCALVGHRVASYDYPSRFVHFTAGVALPLAAAAPAVYLLGRAFA